MITGIFGTGRNGSTLITRLLDGLTNSFVLPVDVNFLSMLNDLASIGHVSRSTVLNATTKPLGHLEKSIPTDLILKYYGPLARNTYETYISQIGDQLSLGQEPVQTLKTKPYYLPADFVESFLNAMSEWVTNDQSVDHFIFKTSETPYIEDYENIFPGMRFIHIIRDPVKVCASQKRTLMFNKKLPAWYLGKDYLETMLDKRWIPHVETIHKKSSSDKHYTVRYEDLTKDPVNIIAGICKWLDIPLPPEPAKQTVLGGRFMKRLPCNTSKKGADTPVDVIPDLGKVLKYDEVLTGRERDFIISRTYRYAKKLGYYDDVTEPDKWTLITRWILPDKWEFMHSNSLMKILKTLRALFYRRYYIMRNLLFINGESA